METGRKSLRDTLSRYGNFQIVGAATEAYANQDSKLLEALAREVDERLERHRRAGDELENISEEVHGALMRLKDTPDGTE